MKTILIFTVFLFLSTSAFADELGDSTNAMQCGNTWINVGAAKRQIRRLCGNPTKVKKWQTHYFAKVPTNPSIKNIKRQSTFPDEIKVSRGPAASIGPNVPMNCDKPMNNALYFLGIQSCTATNKQMKANEAPKPINIR